jgi:hypothetical protein
VRFFVALPACCSMASPAVHRAAPRCTFPGNAAVPSLVHVLQICSGSKVLQISKSGAQPHEMLMTASHCRFLTKCAALTKTSVAAIESNLQACSACACLRQACASELRTRYRVDCCCSALWRTGWRQP